jgi:hypothetical protein
MSDQPTDLDQITDHPFEPATFRDVWPGICGYLIDGWPCGFGVVEHADPGHEER